MHTYVADPAKAHEHASRSYPHTLVQLDVRRIPWVGRLIERDIGEATASPVPALLPLNKIA